MCMSTLQSTVEYLEDDLLTWKKKKEMANILQAQPNLPLYGNHLTCFYLEFHTLHRKSYRKRETVWTHNTQSTQKASLPQNDGAKWQMKWLLPTTTIHTQTIPISISRLAPVRNIHTQQNFVKLRVCLHHVVVHEDVIARWSPQVTEHSPHQKHEQQNTFRDTHRIESRTNHRGWTGPNTDC